MYFKTCSACGAKTSTWDTDLSTVNRMMRAGRGGARGEVGARSWTPAPPGRCHPPPPQISSGCSGRWCPLTGHHRWEQINHRTRQPKGSPEHWTTKTQSPGGGVGRERGKIQQNK